MLKLEQMDALPELEKGKAKVRRSYGSSQRMGRKERRQRAASEPP